MTRSVRIQGAVKAGTAGLRKAESNAQLWSAKGMAGSASAVRAGRMRAGDGALLATIVADSGSFGRNGNLGIDRGVVGLAAGAALEVNSKDRDFDHAVGHRVQASGLGVCDAGHRERPQAGKPTSAQAEADPWEEQRGGSAFRMARASSLRFRGMRRAICQRP